MISYLIPAQIAPMYRSIFRRTVAAGLIAASTLVGAWGATPSSRAMNVANERASVFVVPTVGNSGFDLPDLAGAAFQYGPATGGRQTWVFGGASGVAANRNSTDIGITGPVFGQFGFIQNVGGNISQVVNFDTPGTYRLQYLEAGRNQNQTAFGNLTYVVSLVSNVGAISVLSVTRRTTTAQPFRTVSLQFTIATIGNYTLKFNGTVAPDGDDMSVLDEVNFVAGTTAAGVSVSGRVLTARGRGVENARVLMTDSQGSLRQVLTTRFGYYRFDDVLTGGNYIMSVASKRFQYAPIVVDVTDELSGLDFTQPPADR